VPTALPLPRLDSYVAMPSRFSHQLHLDADLTEAAVGFHVSCSDCHPAPAGSPTLPAHAACARCHADEVALLGGPSMSACAGCHDPAPSPRHATRLIRDDLTFDHAPHRRDLAGAAIGCAACHGGARQADRRDQMAPPGGQRLRWLPRRRPARHARQAYAHLRDLPSRDGVAAGFAGAA
jgi:hypothetical protein